MQNIQSLSTILLKTFSKRTVNMINSRLKKIGVYAAREYIVNIN